MYSAKIRQGQGDREPDAAWPLFPFSNKLHYRYKLDTYKYKFRHVQEPYLVTLCLSGLFFVPASMACISRAFTVLKSQLIGR